MPEDKWSFAPTAGAFKGVRTFAEQVKHVACANYAFFMEIEKKTPPEGCEKGGPNPARTKAELTKYLADSFAYAGGVLATMTPENALEAAGGPYGGQSTRLGSHDAGRLARIGPLRTDRRLPADEQHRPAGEPVGNAQLPIPSVESAIKLRASLVPTEHHPFQIELHGRHAKSADAEHAVVRAGAERRRTRCGRGAVATSRDRRQSRRLINRRRRNGSRKIPGVDFGFDPGLPGHGRRVVVRPRPPETPCPRQVATAFRRSSRLRRHEASRDRAAAWLANRRGTRSLAFDGRNRC